MILIKFAISHRMRLIKAKIILRQSELLHNILVLQDALSISLFSELYSLCEFQEVPLVIRSKSVSSTKRK